MKQKAFTLIELLVVIAIIGILATLAVIALQQARQNARDTKRVADVKQISTALELYFNDNQLYPSSLEDLRDEYMQQLPEAPTPADGICDGINDYTYTVDSEGGDYQIQFCIGKKVSDLGSGTLCMTPGGIAECDAVEETSGEFTDARDGNTYNWVEIGDQVWMTENLKYDNCSTNVWSDSSDTAWCGYYDNNETTYGDYGLLYQWSAAVNVCPSGWHLPTDSEWTILTDYLGSTSATELKASASNVPSWDGTNSTSFTALPAGFRDRTDGSFNDIGLNGFFWTSTEFDSTASWNRYLSSSYADVLTNNGYKATAYSVRCIKD
jgi:uncharacterized protein (TIGR02145 family)/prepilin-type N-terminal cleavage/methylation domain-containing protein